MKKTTGSTADFLPGSCDYLLWYGRDKQLAKFRPIFLEKKPGQPGATGYSKVELPTGERRSLTSDEQSNLDSLPAGASVFAGDNVTSQSIGREKGEGAASWFRVAVDGYEFDPGPKARWKTNETGMRRLLNSERLLGGDRTTLSYKRKLSDFPVTPLVNIWTDTVGQNQLGGEKVYIVQTALKIVERCLLMTTDPGDLVLDPTCGSGTTALVAEQWGRRWITTDTSRISISIARQRLVTAKFDHYRTIGGPLGDNDQAENPATGFKYRTVPHIMLESIAQNPDLDRIFEKHQPILNAALLACNDALGKVSMELRRRLEDKLLEKQKRSGKRSLSDADHRRWKLPPHKFEHWTVPFDTDPEWPMELVDAVTAYRAAWRAKMSDVDACIAGGADQEDLVDQPELVNGVLRVSGPFTVEGVQSEELSLNEEGLFDPTPNDFESGHPNDGTDALLANLHAYLTKMTQHLRGDELTFPDNRRMKFARLEPLFEAASGSVLHANGVWQGSDEDGPATVAVTFGPQYGPVTAIQVEEAIRAAKRYDELVVAGFSFDAEATEIIGGDSHRGLRIHQVYIRPDINPAMDGLLRDTPGSQLFTVFGQPDVNVREVDGSDWVCELRGVDIYNPVENTIRSTGADKVAAWFLDSDYDGRCFCITQAFFPNRNAWEKIAKALNTAADTNAFKAFDGTVSLPFPAGKHKRIAVKVIDPRGNEVMTVKGLEA